MGALAGGGGGGGRRIGSISLMATSGRFSNGLNSDALPQFSGRQEKLTAQWPTHFVPVQRPGTF